MATAKIIIDRRPRKGETHPVLIRIDHKEQWRPIHTGVSCRIDQWDEFNFKLKKNKGVPNYIRYNSTISSALSISTTFIADNINRLNSLSCSELRDEIQALIKGASEVKNASTVNDFIRDYVIELDGAGRIKTARIFENTIDSLNKYAPKIEFKDITAHLLGKYESFCLSNGVGYGGISVYMRSLRTVFNLAIRAKIVGIEKYPFREFKIKKVKTAKRAIKKVAIDCIRNIKGLEVNTPIWHHWNYFRFYFNARGMNFIDLAFLKMENIELDRLLYTRLKGRKPYSMAITSEMKEVLSYYTKEKNTKDLVFPILQDVIDSGDKKHIRITYENRHGDHVKYLNIMGKLAGISSRITTYTIRHSWASGMRDSGAPISAIKEGMGHDNMGTTEIYLSEIEDKIVDDWNEKFLNE